MPGHPSSNEILIYQQAGKALEVRLDGEHETLWLSQKQISELFDKDVRTINEHLGSIYKQEELDKKATIRQFRIVQAEGRRELAREVVHYSLDAIICVGYRVNSKRAHNLEYGQRNACGIVWCKATPLTGSALSKTLSSYSKPSP